MEKIQVLLADDHTIVRQGLRALLDVEPDISVIAEAENGRQAVRLALQLQPDVIVMDIAMPLLNGLEATRQILKDLPAARVLVLSSYGDGEYVRELSEAGAVGYLLKHTASTELIRAIHEAKKGNAFFSPAIAKRLVDSCREAFRRGAPAQKRTNVLTTREAEVLQLIAEGKTNKEIAVELCLSIKTVEKHRQVLMNKLDIHEIAGLTRYAISRGIITNGARLEA